MKGTSEALLYMTKNISDKANTYLQMPDWTQVCRAREQDTKQLRPQVIIITYQQEKKTHICGYRV